MPVIQNPYGRLISIDDPQEYENWLKKPGFSAITSQQEAEFNEQRKSLITAMTKPKQPGDGLYIVTVSQGGKDGYGIASKCLIRELENAGLPTRTYYDGQKVAILFHNPYSIKRIDSPYRMIFTMFESDKIPDDWVDYLHAADQVIVPSKWCAGVFAKAGIKTEVIPLGYDQTVFQYHERINKREKRQDFTFLHYNAFNIRKGFTEVFKAFVKEFRQDEPVKMIFKVTLDQAPIPILKEQYPNIEVIEGKKTEEQLLDIIYRSDCFVFPSRGEGFGLTPLECMATGMPAIVPNAHGISEYFDPEYMYEVRVKETCPGLYQRYKGQDVGNMVVCDIKDLAKKMRWVYEHQDEALEMGKKASEYVKRWTIQKTAQRIKGLYDEIIKNPLPEHRDDGLKLEQV